MRENIELIVPALGDAIAQWVEEAVAQNPNQTEEIVDLVENICIHISNFPNGRYAEVQEIARRGYEVVLRLRVDNPQKRAQTLYNLGNAYRLLAETNISPSQNLQQALAAYNEAEGICRRLGLEKDLSNTLYNLGNAYRLLVEIGVSPSYLQMALAAYNEAEGICRRLGLEKDLSNTLYNLGNAYRLLAETNISPSENLQLAIAVLNEAAGIKRRLELKK